MNTEIRPEVELALRKQIERAVRPVHAGKDRKLAMREELLGHLTAIYTEELARQPDEQVASTAALARFGEPAALTSELNASVGFSEKSAYRVDRGEDYFNRGLRYWFSRREGEPWFSLALRSLFALVLGNLIGLVCIPLLATFLLHGGPADPPTLSQFSMWFLLNVGSQAATIAVMRYMLSTFDNHSRRSRWIWVCAQALLWSLFAAAFTVPFRWSLGGSLPTVKEVADVAISFAVGLSPFFVFGVWCMNKAKQFRQKLELWTRLVIDD
jgi:hypothetical protein